MKKHLLVIAFLVLSFHFVTAQNLIVTISGKVENKGVPLDSIMVENLTNHTWMTFTNLPQRDSYRIDLTDKTLLGTVNAGFTSDNSGFEISTNSPGSAIVVYTGSVQAEASFTVYNTNGQKILSTGGKRIMPGNAIHFRIGSPGVYLLQVTGPDFSKSFKTVGGNSGSEPVIAILEGTPPINQPKSATQRGEDDTMLASNGDSLRISVYKHNHTAPSMARKINGSTELSFDLAEVIDSSAIVSTGMVALAELSGVDLSGLTIQSLNDVSEIRLNGSYHLSNESLDNQQMPLLFMRGDQLIFGAWPHAESNNVIDLDAILMFYFMLFPEVASLGLEHNELVGRLHAHADYAQIRGLLSTSLTAGNDPTDDPAFVALLQTISADLYRENSAQLKSAASNNDVFDGKFEFTFTREGKVTWNNKGPIFASMGFEIQTSDGTPITEPIMIDPSQWVIAPSSIVSWILDNTIFETSSTPHFDLTTKGEYNFVFTNGNSKGQASEKLYNEVKSTNRNAFVSSIIFFIVPVALKTITKECGNSLVDFFAQRAEAIKSIILGDFSQGQLVSEITDARINFQEMSYTCLPDGSPTKEQYFGSIFKKFLKVVVWIETAESLGNIASLGYDFYGLDISGSEKRYFSTNLSFGELEFETLSESTMTGQPESQHQFEAVVTEKKTVFEVSRTSETAFSKKEEFIPASALPFKTSLVKGDATITSQNLTTKEDGKISLNLTMKQDTSQFKVEPEFDTFGMIGTDTLTLAPGKDLLQQLIDMSPWLLIGSSESGDLGTVYFTFSTNQVTIEYTYEYEDEEDDVGTSSFSFVFNPATSEMHSNNWDGDEQVIISQIKINGDILSFRVDYPDEPGYSESYTFKSSKK